jgi:hypothetical protein
MLVEDWGHDSGALSPHSDSVKLRIGKGRILRAGARADEGTLLAGCG